MVELAPLLLINESISSFNFKRILFSPFLPFYVLFQIIIFHFNDYIIKDK